MENKKKQHYVWKEYLRSWCNSKDQIHTYIKSTDKTIISNLTGVVQQRYFYSLEDFTIEEEDNLELLVKNFSNESMLKTNMVLFELYTSYSKSKRLFDNDKIASENKFKIDELLLSLKTNALEDFHSIIENLGSKIMQVKSLNDLAYLDNEDEEFKTMMYLCIQYLRTKKHKNLIEKNIMNFNNVIPKYINLISLLFSQIITSHFLNDKKTRYVLYENLTDVAFITSDQPLLNLSKDNKDQFGFPLLFELFYPINPKIAIMISKIEKYKKYECIKIDESKVNELNEFVFKNSDEFVFSVSENQLEYYKNRFQF
ncbi:DUF4238 domain-containing protein [Flavobacterium azooxidireducens]|uniref:DUF4238 domain-containing protein n=1 Tax=Flavobacterium azooxidireducens TaxID=1871076 RepID=A0ABY4KDD3_9FLAO|nr:DUF4238 domain-containing protein [Flavobacterium azooxidireducens]UPQ78554.1 DUF4238 domain-containing protein [Flavobacterium azooxidireducens]